MKRIILTVAALLAPATAFAQAYHCAIPQRTPQVRADLPSASQPKRLRAIGGYTLAISWSPQYCRSNARDPKDAFQCGANRFGFVLHGLWPDGQGAEWPQYCSSTTLLPPALIRRNLCATPSAQLQQHEWAKHGTCMPGVEPAEYFARSTGAFRRLRYPDMNALSRRSLTAGQLATAIARSNPGIRANMMRITATRQGWLDEVWLCMDTRFRYATCQAHQGGLKPDARVRIWRGRR
jgi:ribonuclease T2